MVGQKHKLYSFYRPKTMRIIVSAILQRWNVKKKEIEILIQERWKPKVDPHYSGMLEIVAGGVEEGETVYQALKREIKEETNLELIKVINDYQSDIYKHNDDEVFVFQPFICQQMIKTKKGLRWIGFVFLCEVRGGLPSQTSEARNFHWLGIKELRSELNKNPHKFFPLQVPVLKYYVKQKEIKQN